LGVKFTKGKKEIIGELRILKWKSEREAKFSWAFQGFFKVEFKANQGRVV